MTPYQFDKEETIPETPSVPAPKDVTTRFKVIRKEPSMSGMMKAIIALVFINGLLIGAMTLLIIMVITKP